MNFYSYASGGLPSVLGYTGGVPTTSPASVVDPKASNAWDNVDRVVRGVTGLGQAAASIISATKGTGTGNWGNYSGQGDPSNPIRIDDVPVFGNRPLATVGIDHNIGINPVLLIGGALAALLLLKRK